MTTPNRSDSTAVPWRSPTVRVVLLSTLLAPLGVPLVSPALPVIKAAFELTDARASLLLSTYFLTGIVLSPFIGLLADRIGRRRVLIPSLLVFSAAGSSITFVGSTIAPGTGYTAVLAIRVVQGTAAAGIFITTVTLVGDAFEGPQRNAVLGANVAVLSAGAAVYPLVGGALAAVAWNAPFVAYLIGFPVTVIAYRALPEPPGDRDERSVQYFGRVLAALSPREAVVLYGTAFGTELLLFGGLFTVLPFLFAERYDYAAIQIGAVITVGEVASAAVASQNGRLVRYVTDYDVIALGFAAVGVGLLGASAASSSVVVAAAAVVLATGWGLTLPSVDDAMSDLVPAQFRAGALSFRNGATFLGRATGPYLFTSLAAGLGYRTLLFDAGAAALACGVLAVVLSR